MKHVLVVPFLLIGVATATAQTPAAASAQAQDRASAWNNWRGPDWTGTAPSGNPPIEWGEDKNVRWKVAIPGVGCSSPIVWGDRIYVTTAVQTDKDGEAPAPEPVAGGGDRGGNRGGDRGSRGNRGRRGGRRTGGRFGSRRPTKIHEFAVLCLDRKDGSTVWNTKVNECVPHEGSHQTGSMASPSPITDGERVYAFFGSRGLHCLDMKGEILWSKDFGRMRVAMSFGEGASPTLYGDTLVVNWDHEGESFITALDAKTGDERWRIPRDEGTSWSTPLVVEVDGRQQVIVSATRASRGYDLKTGAEIWSIDGMTRNCIPTPIHHDGVVYLMSGYRGNALQAIRLSGAKGDLEDSEHVLWTHGQGTSYTPSALLYDGLLYFLRTNNAVLTCMDAKTGEIHYEGKRLEGLRTVYSSPVGVNGRIYITSREGATKVIKLGTEYEELANNQLDDQIDGTAAIVGNEIYLRGRETLYCIAAQK